MSTLLQSYYTIEPSPAFEQQLNDIHFKNIKVNILLSKASHFTPQLYALLNHLSNSYIISINATLLQEHNFVAQLVPKLYILITLNKLYNGQNLLPVFSDGAIESSLLNIEKAKTYFAEQGMENIKFPVFNGAIQGMQTVDECSLTTLQKHTVKGINPLEENASAITQIVAFKNENGTFTIPPVLQNNLVAAAIKHNSKSDSLCLYAEKEELELEVELWKKRTVLYQDFLSLSKEIQEKEYYDVLDWYRKEYEILPLWYKRFGHIIKAATGKRSWGSLFNDDVKKQK